MKKLFLLILILAFNIVAAQEKLVNKWDFLEFEKGNLKHAIPLGLETMDSLNIGNSKLTYFNESLEFKNVYNPNKRDGFNIQSERYVRVKDWKIYGVFSFSKYSEKDAGFTQMANPFRSNPYIIADSITNASWQKQHYFLETKIISPEIITNLKAGLGIKYDVLNGARQIDPRPLDKLVNIELTPQLILEHNQWSFGINGYYNRFREDLNTSIQNNQRPKNIYKLLGLGEYLYNSPIILSGGLSRFYEGNSYGAGITVANYISNTSGIQASVLYKTTKEEVIDGTSSPYNAGLHDKTDVNALITYFRYDEKWRHFVTLQADISNADDTEFIQFLNNSSQQYEVLYSGIMHQRKTYDLQLDYHIQILDTHLNPEWTFGIHTAMHHQDENYATTSSSLTLNNLIFSGYVKKNFNYKKMQYSLEWRPTYKIIGDHKFSYISNPNSTNFVANNIMYPNFYFDTTSFLANTFGFQVTLPKFNTNDSQLYFKVNYENMQSTQKQILLPKGLTNDYLNLTIGLFN